MKKLLDPSLFALIKIMDLIGDALKKGGGGKRFLIFELKWFWAWESYLYGVYWG